MADSLRDGNISRQQKSSPSVSHGCFFNFNLLNSVRLCANWIFHLLNPRRIWLPIKIFRKWLSVRIIIIITWATHTIHQIVSYSLKIHCRFRYFPFICRSSSLHYHSTPSPVTFSQPFNPSWTPIRPPPRLYHHHHVSLTTCPRSKGSAVQSVMPV